MGKFDGGMLRDAGRTTKAHGSRSGRQALAVKRFFGIVAIK
jgi:hypothetical protein